MTEPVRDRRRRLVSHPVFGEGEILDSRWHGTELLVHFQSGLRLWLPTQRVRLLSNIGDFVPGEAQPALVEIDTIQARRMIEAFRLGIVPHQDVESFTFGREKPIAVLDAALESLARGQGDVFMVEGEYGSGKTHLLEYVHHRALASGMATSLVQFDPAEVSPHRPKRVYREVVHNLRYIKDATEHGFRDLLRSGTALDMADHVFLGPVLAKLGRIDAGHQQSEVFWQWIEGESTKEYATEQKSPFRVKGGQRIPALYDFSTAADLYCNILSGMSWMARELGMKGLVLLVDEAETVTHLWDIMYLAKSVNFMDGLVRTAQNDPDLKRINDRMVHNQVRPVPYIYRDPSLLLVFATTPSPYDYAYIKLANRIKHRVELEPLEDKALLDAFSTMVMIYRRAYPDFTISDLDQKRLLREASRRNIEGVRAFIKFSVEALDVTRLRAQGVLPQNKD
ncbi:MAG TPA: BREX system ATP-binding domain-containing protein [bacterium]|nr:BREX system ATP-binding domain-containing protein [bacterium]